MDLSKEFSVDEDKAARGVTHKIVGDIEVTCVYARSLAVEAYRNSLLRKFSAATRAKGQGEAQAYRQIDALICARVTKAWRNVVDGGAEVPCTPENVERLCLKYDVLREGILNAASSAEDYRPELDEDGQGN